MTCLVSISELESMDVAISRWDMSGGIPQVKKSQDQNHLPRK